MIFKPPEKALLLWRIYLSALTVCLLAVCITIGVVVKWELAPAPIIFISVAALFIWFFYLPELIKSTALTVTPEAIVLSRGIFIRRRYVLPNSALVYAEHFNTPVSSAMGLVNLKLKAARAQLTVYTIAESDLLPIIQAVGNYPGGGQNG